MKWYEGPLGQVAFAVFVIIFLASAVAGLINLGSQEHPASQCVEDEDWIVVTVDTPGSVVFNNVTRMCVNYQENYEEYR